MCKMKLRERCMYVDVYGAIWREVSVRETKSFVLVDKVSRSRERCVR